MYDSEGPIRTPFGVVVAVAAGTDVERSDCSKDPPSPSFDSYRPTAKTTVCAKIVTIATNVHHPSCSCCSNRRGDYAAAAAAAGVAYVAAAGRKNGSELP